MIFCLLAHLPTSFFAYLLAILLVTLLAWLFAFLLASSFPYLLAYLLAFLLTYLCTCLLALLACLLALLINTCMLAYLLSYLLPCFVSSLTYLFSSAVFSFCLYLICFVYCSAWLRIKLYTHHQHTNSYAAISQLSKLNTFNFCLVFIS